MSKKPVEDLGGWGPFYKRYISKMARKEKGVGDRLDVQILLVSDRRRFGLYIFGKFHSGFNS